MGRSRFQSPTVVVALAPAVRVVRLLGMLLGDVLAASVGRALVPCAIGGYTYTAADLQPSSWLWTAYGMLLGTALGLILDDDSIDSRTGPFSRIDHAAMAILLAISCHLAIITSHTII